MKITADEAMSLTVRILTRNGISEEYARIVGDHLIDAALCGYEFASLPRIFAILDQLRKKPPAGPIRVVKEDHQSAIIDGGDNVGYVVTLFAMDKAIEICKKNRIAVVAANNTWYGGRLAYYMERAAGQDLIAFHTANTTPMVAPYGGIDKALGTNPFAMGIPTDEGPVIVDFGTSATTWGEILLRQRTGEPLPQGWAVDKDGVPTQEPPAALEGAILPWGGHRGFGLSMVAQLLGILAGGDIMPAKVENFGLFFLVLDPGLLMDVGVFKQRAGQFIREMKAGRVQAGVAEIRYPGEGSRRRRAQNTEREVEVDEKVYHDLLLLLEEKVGT